MNNELVSIFNRKTFGTSNRECLTAISRKLKNTYYPKNIIGQQVPDEVVVEKKEVRKFKKFIGNNNLPFFDISEKV